MLGFFRLIGIVEGVTTLALFLVAMPAKYIFDQPGFVPAAGSIHGFAFVLYIVVMVIALWGRGFSPWEWARTTLASFVPFGTFLNDAMLARKEAQWDARKAA